MSVKADPESGGYGVGGFVAEANATWFENCLVKNVEVHSSNSSSEKIGGFAAESEISGFKNCSFEGTIHATATYVGGFVGFASWHEEEPGKTAFDIFEDCSAKGDMYARRKSSEMDGYVGGFAGWSEQVNISKSSFEGSIKAPADSIYVSGFAIAYSKVSFDQCYTKFEVQTQGEAEISGFLILKGDIDGIHIENSYAKGTINSGANSYSAGFINMNSAVHPTVKNCYAAVSAVENSNYRFAFVYNFDFISTGNKVNTTNCFYDLEFSNAEDDHSDAKGKTTEEMKTQSTYTDWDFDTIWDISPDNYPHLRWEN